MTEVATQSTTTTYREAFDALAEQNGVPRWLTNLRAKAMDRFESLGFPTTRHEEWRFTNVKPIATTPFALAEPVDVPGNAVEPYALGGISIARLVFVNGHYDASLSVIRDELPTGLTILNLADALRSHPDEVKPHLAKHGAFEDDAFSALNTAFVRDGAFIEVDKGVEIDRPIHLLFVSTTGDTPTVSHPRNLVVVHEGAKVTVVESHVSHDVDSGSSAPTWSNGVTEFVIEDNADAHHYLIEREADDAYNIETLAFEQGASSRFESHSALFGGAIVRNNVRATLSGERAHSVINGLYMPRGSQHMDNHMRVRHSAPNCDSRQFYKGVLDDTSRGVFAGRIVVDQVAQLTDAKQSNRNLLLSDKAQTNAMPQLEIYADDVKCTHGATTGAIEPSHLFYLKARGISEDVAMSMLVYAFAAEVLERMTVAPLRDQLESLLIQRLPNADKLTKLLQ